MIDNRPLKINNRATNCDANCLIQPNIFHKFEIPGGMSPDQNCSLVGSILC